jgi:hypothetical protein
MPVILATIGSINRRMMAQASLGKKQDPISKKTSQTKRAGDMAQVVDLLPSKWEALSSNPSTLKKQNQKCCGLCG